MAKKLTIYVHHKRREKLLPRWMLDNPDFTFKSTYKKRTGPTQQGDATRAMTVYARRLMDERGMTAKEAASVTVGFIQDGLRKLGKNPDKAIGLWDPIYWALRKKRGGPKPAR